MSVTSPRSSSLQNHYSQSRNVEESVTIEWKDVEYCVREKDSKKSQLLQPVYVKKKILKSVNGFAKSGQLVAIMGPTGSGKTSLLNVLAARVPNGAQSTTSLTGNITINGIPRVEESFRRISAFVLQDDKLYPHLTVYETLLLAAHFYLPDNITLDTKHTLVDNCITELGLVKARNTIIGDEKVRGVSGGERKRANVAVQLISDPAVLFLDEPTSGLDSFQAMAVVESMKAMALNGRLVVMAIHQPRSSIFDMFDQLLLMSEGRTMYHGPAHAGSVYFASAGFECPKLFNPSDFFLDILSPDHRTPEAEVATNQRIAELGDRWAEKSSLLLESSSVSNGVEVKQLMSTLSWARFCRNFQLLSWRAATEQMREIPTLVIKLCVTCFFALVIGGIYSNSGYDQKSISNRSGLLFVVSINQGFNGCMGVLNTFPKEKIIVNRERSSNAYDTFSYFISKVMVELPINVVPCVIFGCIIYYMVGLNPHTFGYFLLILMMENVTATALGLAVSALMPNVDAATALGMPLVIVALLFGGFYINISSLPIVANWIPYMSFLKWTYEALCINEFTGEKFTCEGSQGGCMQTGEEVLYSLSFQNTRVESAAFGLGMVLIGFAVSALVFLHYSRINFLPLGHVGSKLINFK